jgi:hypothetical protein
MNITIHAMIYIVYVFIDLQKHMFERRKIVHQNVSREPAKFGRILVELIFSWYDRGGGLEELKGAGLKAKKAGVPDAKKITPACYSVVTKVLKHVPVPQNSSRERLRETIMDGCRKAAACARRRWNRDDEPIKESKKAEKGKKDDKGRKKVTLDEEEEEKEVIQKERMLMIVNRLIVQRREAIVLQGVDGKLRKYAVLNIDCDDEDGNMIENTDDFRVIVKRFSQKDSESAGSFSFSIKQVYII